mgnify:CR=1 FL=1
MRRHTNRSHAWATAPVGDAEGLVQVEMADIGTERTRTAKPDLRIEVGPIEVHLPTVLMHNGADLTDAGFKDAVGGGVGDHQCGDFLPVLIHPGANVIQVDISLIIAIYRDHLESRHDRTCFCHGFFATFGVTLYGCHFGGPIYKCVESYLVNDEPAEKSIAVN